MAVTVLSLCSGYGGLDIGLDAAIPGGARTVGYVEREAFAAAILLARMEDATLEPAPIWCGNLQDCDYTPFYGVDWLTAGFPCQPFSTAGKREGQADERWLWDNLVGVIRAVRPRWCLFENVPGLVRLGLGPVLRDLATLGFDAEWGVLRAADVGASHLRKRVFVLAKRRDGVDEGRGRRVKRSTGGEGGSGHPDSAEPDVGDPTHLVCERSRERRHKRPLGGSSTPLVAHPRRELLEGGHDGGAGGLNREGAVVGPGRPAIRRLFAPGPAALDVWARVLTETPEVEPSLCRVADGVTGWLDNRAPRLRAIGNGVVPLQAAVAVRALADRAGWRLT